MQVPCFGHSFWQSPQLEKLLQLVPHAQLGKQQPNGPLDHPLGSHGVHPVMDVATNWLQEMAIQEGLVEQKGMVAEGDAKLLLG